MRGLLWARQAHVVFFGFRLLAVVPTGTGTQSHSPDKSCGRYQATRRLRTVRDARGCGEFHLTLCDMMMAALYRERESRFGGTLAAIRIISNPYHRSVVFMSKLNGNWTPLGDGNNPNSKLLSRKYANGFFPFKAREVIDQVLVEYAYGNESVEIEFEGPDDEWVELSNVCASADLRDRVNLERGNRFLINARDILREVRGQFDDVYPIVANELDKIPEASNLLSMFRAASGNDVPICVVGNYSSGKSTFINALLGIELLPSGDKPLTSRVFRIERSGQPDRAAIEIDYLGGVLNVNFGARSTSIKAPSDSGELVRELHAAIPDRNDEPILSRMRTALDVINRKSRGEELLGDLVTVQAPYERAPWMQDKNLVIFDTPGSNSSSNEHHLQILRDAMRGMSDGLPVYVCEYSSIDSTDNAELYNQIRQIDALDERFAMIVVNKADAADLPEDGWHEGDEEDLMATAVVHNLFAQGAFFVSSIMGLGAKLDGRLCDRHYARCYRQLLNSFQDPSDRFYTRLYIYDLMPEQQKAEMLEEAAGLPDRVYANSGLYSIECGIEDFATKYSVYNKCYRSDELFDGLIILVDKVLEAKSDRLTELKRLSEEEFSEIKSGWIRSLHDEAGSLRSDMNAGYMPHMDGRDYLAAVNLTMDEINDWEKGLSKVQHEKGRIDEKIDAARTARAFAAKRLGDRFTNILDTRDIMGFCDLASGFMSDASKAIEALAEARGAQSEADRFVSEDLLALIREHFDKGLDSGMRSVDEESKAYWNACAERCRSQLLDFISDGEFASEGKQGLLRTIIMEFRTLGLEDSAPEIMDIRLPFNPDRLWKAPVFLQHNMELRRRIERWRDVIQRSHQSVFNHWLDDLETELVNGIVDLNPELRKKYEDIRETERDLDDLRFRRDRLKRAEENVSSYMAWRGEE